MEIKQIYAFVNDATKEAIGEEALLQEDLGNIVAVGEAIFNANAKDAYVRTLLNKIGKTIFDARVYKGTAPSVLMDGWEYGSVLEKVTAHLPHASENESWQLTDGASYDQDIFYKPTVEVKYFNKKTTFEVDMSFTDEQLKQSFTSAEKLNAFISMLFVKVENVLTIMTDELIMRAINNLTGATIHEDFGSSALSSKSGVKAVNLLYLYNQAFSGATITKAEALKTPAFIRFACYTMGLYADRLAKASKLFNIGGLVKFTPKDLLHVVLLSEFENASKIYLQSDVFNKELVQLPKAETVAYWQGSGTDYGFDSTSKLDIVTADGDAIETDGILGVMFDRDAVAVCNMNKRVTSHYNAKAEFYSNFYKQDASYFNDYNENFVVFFIQ